MRKFRNTFIVQSERAHMSQVITERAEVVSRPAAHLFDKISQGILDGVANTSTGIYDDVEADCIPELSVRADKFDIAQSALERGHGSKSITIDLGKGAPES